MPRAAPSPLKSAIEVFIAGFGFTQSFTHPYVATPIGPLRVMRDAPRTTKEPSRREEWVVTQTAPATVDQLAREHSKGHFCLSVITTDSTPNLELIATYKALHYRYGCAEPLMVHSLQRIPRINSPATIRRVRTQADADRLAKTAGHRQILPEHRHAKAPLRQYIAEIDGKIVGWVRSITCQQGNWCSNMFVLPKHRRKRIGSALLAHMLRNDRKHGVKLSVLTASNVGSKLYLGIGYRQIGTLLLFTPKR